MAVRPVLRMGHPLLARVAAPLGRFGTPELRGLVRDMDDTMRALNGAGIAAPQIGVLLRVVIFEVAHNPRYPRAEAVPYTVLVNPETASSIRCASRTCAISATRTRCLPTPQPCRPTESDAPRSVSPAIAAGDCAMFLFNGGTRHRMLGPIRGARS